MHTCGYFCHPPYHATNAVVNVPPAQISPKAILEYLWATGQPAEEVERIIPVTEVNDLEAWMHQYEDGQGFSLPPDVACYGIVIVAKYKEDEIEYAPHL